MPKRSNASRASWHCPSAELFNVPAASVVGMPGQFSFSRPQRRGPSDSWFRVGTVEVTTTTFVAALGVLSFFLYALDKTLLGWFAFLPHKIVGGQIWRLALWPLLNRPDVWTAFTIFLLWLFGNQLELQFGRVRFTKFMVACIVVPAVLTTGCYYVFGGVNQSNFDSLGTIALQGIRLMELGVFIAYIAEHPGAKFFFGIPGWVIGAVVIAVDVLSFMGDRLWLALVFELLIAATSLVMLRGFGFGQSVPWIPLLPLPAFVVGTSGKRNGGSRSSARPSKKSSKRVRRGEKGSNSTVTGPWPGSGISPASQHEVDRILDKIASSGINSLSADERAQLEAASKARREKNL